MNYLMIHPQSLTLIVPYVLKFVQTLLLEKIYVWVLDTFCCSLQNWSTLLCIGMVRSFLILRSIWYSLKIKNIPEE